MSKLLDDARKELNAAFQQGTTLCSELAEKKEGRFRNEYQSWYSRSLLIVKQLMPERLSEFINLYEDSKRKAIDFGNYSIADYLRGMSIRKGLDEFNSHAATVMRFNQQILILESVKIRLDSIFANLQGLIQGEIFDNELEAANELWRSGHLRSAGTLAGVVLERHLLKVAGSRSLNPNKKKPTLSDWNDLLKDNGIYDIPVWRGIQRLGDIRNLCAHAKDREPTKEEVDEMIRGVEKITKTIM